MGRLSNTAVKTASRPGRFSDGDGLFLVVGATGSKSWVCRVQKFGRRRDFGLGSASKVSLALAREKAREIRSWMEAGLDPILERRRAGGIPTFREAAAMVHATNKETWRNGKHRAQWLRTLEVYAFPSLGNLQVSEITGPLIRDVLAKIWISKPETARRLRQRIGAVLDWSYAAGYRELEAPMRALSKGLPRQPRMKTHFAAMAYADVPSFMIKLRARETHSRLALEFAILTAVRSGEVRGACWSEIDLEKAVWTIPASRMKADREHAVPLASSALEVLRKCLELRQEGQPLVFPSPLTGKMLSDMTLTKLLRNMKLEVTVHGFRSAFRDWVSEMTLIQGEVAEAALAHAVSDKTEAAYRRGALFEKRRGLMAAWAEYCD
jgi:integrase